MLCIASCAALASDLRKKSKNHFCNCQVFFPPLALQIGNAVLNDATDQLGMVEYAWSHAIISDELYSAVRRECDSFKEEADGGRPGKGCSPALRAFLGAYDDIDIYSIYTPTCLLLKNVSAAGATPRRRRRPARLVAAPRLLSKHVRTRHSLCLCRL